MSEMNSPAPKVKPLSTMSGGSSVSENGDLAAQVDFYGDQKSAPALEANDPNVDWEGPAVDDEVDATDDGGDDEEGSEGEEAGEVAEEEEEAGEGDDDDSSEEEEEGEAEDDEEQLPPEKRTKLRIGDEDFDVPLDSTIPVKVNGEIQQASVKDLMEAFSSKTNLGRELREASEAKAELVEHRRKVARDLDKRELDLLDKEGTINQGRKLLSEGNFEEALNLFFEHNPEHWEKFDDLMMGYYPEFAKLDQTTRRLLQSERRQALQGKKQQRDSQTAEMQKGIERFNQFKQQSCEANGLTESEVEDGWDQLVQMANKGELNAAEIERIKNSSAEEKWKICLGQALSTKTRTKITNVIKKQFPKLASKTSEIIQGMEGKLALQFLIKSTKEDIAGIIKRDYNGNIAGKPAKDKVARTNSLRDKAQPRHKLRMAATREDDDDPYDQSNDREEPTGEIWGMQRHRY